MSEEDINFLISIQDLEQPDFDNACLERENKKLRDKYEQRERKWEKWATEKTILSTKVGEYLCKYQNLKREYTKQNKILNVKNKEIERLNKQIEEYQKALDETTSEKIDLENIIKEVREYIEDDRLYMSNGNVLSIANTGCGKKILEILDKGE